MQAPARFDNDYPDLDCHIVIKTNEMCIWTAAFGGLGSARSFRTRRSMTGT
jgi:hypothetical protein